MELPAAFNPANEDNKFLARMKQRASKNFKWTVSRSLEDAMLLAYWCFIFGKEDQTMEVNEFLQQYQFAGNFALWGWVERSLALSARLMRAQGKNDEAAQCIARIQAAGFVKSRLSRKGPNILTATEQNAKLAQSDGDLPRERDWRIVLLAEQCTVIEMGGSADLPPREAEAMFQENLGRLRELVGA